MIKKVLAFCVREKENKYEILVLSKINGKGTEVPGGSVDEGGIFRGVCEKRIV